MVKDRFSEASEQYHRYRPAYPAELFEALARLAPATGTLWDCGCGSGQATLCAAPFFRQVVATDLSWQQLAKAPSAATVSYAAARAEQPPLAAHAVDAVLVAQALHWFDFQDFFTALDRVLKPQGLFLAVTYNLLSVSPEVDALVHELYYTTLHGCWDAERRHVETAYATIPIPYTPVDFPALAMTAQWQPAHLLGYLRTWSGVRQYQRLHGADPVATIERRLLACWPEGERAVSWPLSCIARRKL